MTYDTSGYANATVVTGTLSTLGVGSKRYAVTFDGVDDQISVTSNSRISITGAFTISFWFKITGTVGDYDSMLTKTTSNAWNDGFGMDFRADATVGSTRSLVFWVNSWNTNYAYKAFDYSSDTSWHHVACVYDMASVIIYIDGLKGTDDTFSSAVSTTVNNLLIGTGTGGFFTPFSMDDFRLYDKALSQPEVIAMYHDQYHPAIFRYSKKMAVAASTYAPHMMMLGMT